MENDQPRIAFAFHNLRLVSQGPAPAPATAQVGRDHD